MLAALIDQKGIVIEWLKDIPVTLKDEESGKGGWNFPVASTKKGIAYEVIEAKISTIVVKSGARIKVFVFTNKDQHKAILDYME